VWDGQVFNAAEVAGFLEARGRSAHAGHPGELLLGLYAAEGPAGLRRADGQFALAVWDRRRHRLVLCRDFLGTRPLYYHAAPDGVIFASEIKALLAHPRLAATPDLVGVSHYLTFLGVPGPRTLFAGISRLGAGTAATCAPDGSVEPAVFWDLLDVPLPAVDDARFYAEETRRLLESAVRRRSPDGPVGALLSGGNDSGAMAALLARGAGPLHTFTVGLREVEGQPGYSDLLFARKVARLVGARHHELLLGTDDFVATLPRITEALDDLVAEPSSVFLYHALAMARGEGLRVVFTGEANDELSGGHVEMTQLRRGYYRGWSRYLALPVWLRRLAARVAPSLWPAQRDLVPRAAAGSEYFWSLETAWMDSDKPDVLSAPAWEEVRHDGAEAVVRESAARLRHSEHHRRDYLDQVIYALLQDRYLGNLMLGKLDLLSSALGLEARCPYTAPGYAHFVFNIPAREKIRKHRTKAFFKRAIAGLLPPEVIYRPRQGARAPLGALFRGRLGEVARPVLLDTGLTQAGVLRGRHLGALLAAHREGRADFSRRLWTALLLNLWYERWIAGREAQRRTALPPVEVRVTPAVGG
jgi:asparagine synthase (glutamine-hydrolysing)